MPHGTRKVRFSFEETHITHYGGMWLIQRFCNKLGLRRLLQRYTRDSRRTGVYAPDDLFLALMFAAIMGLRRINKTEILQYNGMFLDMLGLKRFPDQSTIRRFLIQLSPTTIRRFVRLHDSLRAYLFPLPQARTSLTFDLDSTVLVVYGHAEGARVGYNPKKRGRRSYHPLLGYEAHYQEFWHGSLRPGNAGTSSGILRFISRCFAKVPSQVARSRIRFRMDSGFYSHRVCDRIEREGSGYVIVAREYANIKKRSRGCHFRAVGNDWEVGEFREKVHHRDAHPRRFIVVRRPIPRDPAEASQLTLFKDRKYAYHVFVTNLDLSPWRIYLFYSLRAVIEKNIRELQYDFSITKIPTHHWIANVAYFQLLLFAANIVHWFKRLCLPPERLTTTVDTIRSEFLLLPARLVREAHRNVVKLPRDYHYRNEFLDAARAINRLRLPRTFRFCK